MIYIVRLLGCLIKIIFIMEIKNIFNFVRVLLYCWLIYKVSYKFYSELFIFREFCESSLGYIIEIFFIFLLVWY